MKDIQAVFERFLKSNEVYDMYMANVRDLDRLYAASESTDYIDDAFTWSETPEGWKFWDIVDSFWRVTIKLNRLLGYIK